LNEITSKPVQEVDSLEKMQNEDRRLVGMPTIPRAAVAAVSMFFHKISQENETPWA
jgi:hypothetical protein